VDEVGKYWYLVAALLLVIILGAAITWRLFVARRSSLTDSSSLLDQILVWPLLLKLDRKLNAKHSWLTKRELIFAIVMLAIVVIAIIFTPAGRVR
jgi:hypothetical protein